MSATSGGGGSVSEGSEAGGSTQSTMSVSDSPSTSFQTSLADNVTKITLSDENSAGSFGADMTGSKINLSLDEKQQKDGIVNVAFDYEEGTNRGGGGGGGDFKLINESEKKDKVPEAVNLELVNMVPYSNGNGTSYGVPINGIPTKKDSEQVDISSPYDEYFVPVNEHKKYMRGEKLYVTKDKRRPTSWRRCLSWVVACTVISVVLILAILAGTGVILSQESNLVKEASVGRNFAGSNLKPSVTDKSKTPTAEMYMYVPRSIESEIVIDNLDFDPAFEDRNSSAYHQFTTKVEDHLKMILFDREKLEFGASDVALKVVNISHDPFKVNYRIGWNYKQGVNNPPEPIKMEDVKKRLVESLAKNQGYIDKYHIDGEAIKVNHVINACQTNNGGCSHICYYNYVSQQFTCTCPTHLILDHSQKNCVAWTGSSEDDAVPVPSQTETLAHEHEFGSHYEHDFQENDNKNNAESSLEPRSKGGETDGQLEHEPVAEPVPEPTAEPNPSREDGSFSDSEVKHLHSSYDGFDHKALPEPTTGPNSENVLPAEHESKQPAVDQPPESTADSISGEHDHDFLAKQSSLEHEPAAEPTPVTAVDLDNKGREHDSNFMYETEDHELSAEPTPAVTANSNGKDHDHSSHSVYSFKEHEPSAEPTPGSTSNSYGEDQDHSSHSVYSFKEHEPSAEPTPTPTTNSHGEDHDHSSHSVHNFKEHEPSSKQTPAPTANSYGEDQDHSSHSVHNFKEHEPSAEPTPAPTTNSHGEDHDHSSHSVHNFKEHEPSAEPTPAPTTNSHGEDHDHSSHSVYSFKEHEPSAKQTPEPTSEKTIEPDSEGRSHDHVLQSVYKFKDDETEPTPEPGSEPTSESKTENRNHGQNDHFMSGTKDHESSAEPTVQPIPELTTDENPNSDQSVHTMEDHKSSLEPISEPTTESPSGEKSYGSNQYHSNVPEYGLKEHEYTTERAAGPTAEPTSAGKSLDHNGISVYTSNEHKPAAKPIPEFTSDSSAELNSEGQTHIREDQFDYSSKDRGTESTTNSSFEPTEKFKTNRKDHDTISHSLHGFKYHESEVEPTPEPEPNSEGNVDNHKGHFQYKSKNLETAPEASFESSTEFMHPNFNSTYESSGSQPNPELKSEKKVKPSPKLISESSLENTSSDSETSEPNETTINPKIQQEVTNSDNTFSSNLNHQPASPQEQMQVTESTTEYSTRIHHDLQNEQDKNKLEHYVPYLEDILIRKPSPTSSENQNETIISQNPLDNVELTENGKPVIEEILIDKSGRKTVDQEEMPIQTNSKSDSTLTTKPAESNNNSNSAVIGQSNKNSTEAPVLMSNPDSDPNSKNIQEDILTDYPRIIEYIPDQYPTQEKEQGKETEKLNSKQTESSQGDFEITTKNADQDTFRISPHLTGNNIENETINSRQKTVSLPQDNLATTTMSSKTDFESHTIPVTIEFLGSDDRKVSGELKPKKDNETDMSKINVKGGELAEDSNKNAEIVMSDGRLGKNEYITKNFSGSKTFSDDDGIMHETATKSPQIAMSTLLSILNPDGVKKINEQLENNRSANEKASTYKSNDEVTQTEGNERTKSSEEISNTIKDEQPDNEEFNTLIDQEYKNKESTPTENRETTKYPNKSFKSEKKKLKDYVKGEKVESDKKTEVTVEPGVTSEDFILQKHVNGNENTFDLDYSLPNDHTTKHDGGVTIIDPHGIEGVPGVSLKPYGINNHDISVLQTVAPDFRMETSFPSGGQDLETLKPDFKNKFSESKDGESKLDKDYKFDKDYKYEKQKVSKKKELKKKIGGKDGKNVELEEGRKYFTEISKDDLDISQEFKGASETTMSPSEKIMFDTETGTKIIPRLTDKETTISESTSFGVKSDGPESILHPGHATEFDMETVRENITEHPDSKSGAEKTDPNKLRISGEINSKPISNLQGADKQNGHLDEPIVKTIYDASSPGTVYDEQLPETVKSDPEIQQTIMNTSFSKEQGSSGTPETVLDGIKQNSTLSSSSGKKIENNGGLQEGIGENTTFIIHENTPSVMNITLDSATAHPTIIIHGQSGNLQDGHILRFANSTLHNSGNSTFISFFNGTLNHPDGHSFSFTNYNATFPNGSAVRPTIFVHGQSGTLQDGHEIKFGNSTFQTFLTSSEQPNRVYKNSNVYRIDNTSLPGTVFDGNFNPQNGHYHMFSNNSGTFVYSNTSSPPAFIIKGESGDFGNATAYIIGNNTRSSLSNDFTGPHSVIFRNSTVFAVENTENGAARVQKNTVQPDELSNETIHFTHQMSPSFVSSGTAYQVNNYFGYISKCAAGQFQCVNGTSKRGSACISLSSKCDSISDCSDGSDELGCIENGCPGNFQCADGTCLKRNLVCNGILDCSDGSDEKNCESWKCEFDEFQCPSGRCIPVVWQCDSKPDCDNHTDEYNCQTSCGNDEYLCPEGWCIPLTYKCNGIKECSNGEDEQLCDCSHEEFKCQTGGCVSLKQVCDGLDDCPDRSDEWDCVKLEPNSNLLKIRSTSGNYEPVCADNWSTRYSDEVCASLGYFSSVPLENDNNSFTTEKSFYVLKNDTTAGFKRKIIVNLKKSEGNCSSQKFVDISCQEFTCGSRSMTDSSSVEARLVGGMSATAGQWPSVALLYNIRNFHSCTANVLTPRWVLASYNCLKMGNKIFNEQDWKFFGGSTIFEAERENAETRKIISIIPHPQVKFNQFLFTNDLALVELDQSLQFTSNLGAVCLPEQEMQPRQICVTAGWGINNPEDKTIRQQLQYLPVPTMNLTECNSTEHYSGFITDDKICAGYNSAQKSLCYNEEGAPLMCVNDKGEWELQGVLSYQSNCGRGSHPSIFSSIKPVTDWIKKTIGNNFQRKPLSVSNR